MARCYGSSEPPDLAALEAEAGELGFWLGTRWRLSGLHPDLSEIERRVQAKRTFLLLIGEAGGATSGVSFQLIGNHRLRAFALSNGWGAVVTQVPGPVLPAWSFRKPFMWVEEQDRKTALSLLQQLDGGRQECGRGRVTLYMADMPLGAVLLELQARTGLTFCYEDHYLEKYGPLGDTPLMTARVSVAFDSVDVEEALQLLSHRTGEFVWSRSGPVVNIVSPSCLKLPQYSMNRMLLRVHFSGNPQSLYPTSARFDPLGVTLSERPEKASAAEFTLESATVREFLNQLCVSTGTYWYSLYREDKQRLDVYLHRQKTLHDIVADIKHRVSLGREDIEQQAEAAAVSLTVEPGGIGVYRDPELPPFVTRPGPSGQVTQPWGPPPYGIGAICAVAALGALVLIIRRYRKGPGSRPGHGDDSGDANAPSTGPAGSGSPAPISDDSSTSAGGQEDAQEQ